MYSSNKFEGDIDIPFEQIMALKKGRLGGFRNALLDRHRLWVNGEVPYIISKEDFNEDQTQLILDAMENFHKNTCIR